MLKSESTFFSTNFKEKIIMDERELQNITEIITGRCVYAHTVAKDELIHLPVFKKPVVVNCNTGNSNTQGEHWLTFYVYNVNNTTVSEYYDSYGESCDYYDIKFPYKIIKSNKKQHQHSDSDLCGKYCIYFTWHRLRNIPFNTVINSFGDNHLQNDIKTDGFYHDLLSRLKLPRETTEQNTLSKSCMQMCKVVNLYKKCQFTN